MNTDELRRLYFHRLVYQVRDLRLMGVDPKAASDERGSERPLSSVCALRMAQWPENGETA